MKLSDISDLFQNLESNYVYEIDRALKELKSQNELIVFQEKHTSGHLWFKRTYYTYKKYSESHMYPVSILDSNLIERQEKK